MGPLEDGGVTEFAPRQASSPAVRIQISVKRLASLQHGDKFHDLPGLRLWFFRVVESVIEGIAIRLGKRRVKLACHIPGRLHKALARESFNVSFVYLRPDTAFAAWCELVDPRDLVTLAKWTVDPSIAQRNIKCFCIRNALMATSNLKKPNPNSVVFGVMRGQPEVKPCRRLKRNHGLAVR
jgi:hypothetical protein